MEQDVHDRIFLRKHCLKVELIQEHLHVPYCETRFVYMVVNFKMTTILNVVVAILNEI